MKKIWIIVLIAVLVLLGAAYYMKFGDNRVRPPLSGEQDREAVEYYTCVMHPQVRQPDPGNCPICSMKLVPKYREAHPGPIAGRGTTDSTVYISPQKQQLVGLTSVQARVRPLSSTLRAVGRVAYAEPRLAVVTLHTGGWIQSLSVDFTGMFVHKGEQLLTVYSPELVSAQREYLIARQALQDTSASRSLTDEPGEFSLLKTARERLRLWQITDEQIAALDKSGEPLVEVPILSPIAGYVVEKSAVKGMRIEPGSPLYRIADLSTVWIYADLYENEASLAKAGMSALIEFPYSSDRRTIAGKIIYVDPFLNAATRTLRVRLEVANPELALKPEMFVDVKIASSLGNRLSVPRDAVLSGGTGHYVFVDKGNGYFQPRFVTVGAEADDYAVISSGLKAGEMVVTSANFLLDSESRLKGVLDQMAAPMTRQGD